MIKAIVIDDENKSVQTLVLMLHEYCPEVDVVATASSAKEGILQITQHQPDLVFLDVEMTGGNGFTLLENLPERNFKVIFVTAHDHYAIKAIKVHALDYILKPINVDELVKAVNTFGQEDKIANKSYNTEIEALLQHIHLQRNKKIGLPTYTGIEYVSVDEIMYLSAERSYCNIFMQNKKTIMVSKSMNEIEEMIGSKQFFRIHKSYTVNMSFIKKYLKTDGGLIEMADGTKLYLSRNKKDEFSLAMQHFIVNPDVSL
jgi:two-component system, LytTR family, response regulator